MLSLIEKKKIGDIDAYKSYIPEWSSLIGKTVEDVVKEYKGKIIVDHISNSPLEIETRQEIDPKTVLEYGMSIKISGEWKDICNFTAKYGLP